MADKGQDKPKETPAAKEPEVLQPNVRGGTHDHAAFRRDAALAILGAYVHRHGGFTSVAEEMDTHMRLVWKYADAFVALENAPPLPPPAPVAEFVLRQPTHGQRPASPSDEWAVRDGDNWKRGFVTRQEAEWYATGRPGAEIVLVSGPGTTSAPATM